MQNTLSGTSVSDPYNRYHIVAYRNLFFEKPTPMEQHIETILRRTNRLKEARGLAKQETDSHIAMLEHHDFFDLHFALDVSEDELQRNLTGYDDEGILRYQYLVIVRDNA